MKTIVGIDPGTTTGIAILDMKTDSGFCKTFSKKGATLSELCDYISENGTPVIIACDVKKPPSLVKKTAAVFDAVLSKPRRTIRIAEKRRLVNRSIRNRHEMDALAAALLAKRKFSILFRKVESIMKRRNLQCSDDVKELLIKRKAGNINQAVQLLKKV